MWLPLSNNRYNSAALFYLRWWNTVSNAAVNRQLSAVHLRAIDVDGDGKCFFRALFVSLYGD